jgi:hypothetical protein
LSMCNWFTVDAISSMQQLECLTLHDAHQGTLHILDAQAVLPANTLIESWY